MKIYDCFIFFNELDLLEIRLNTLNEHVDYFVLVESTKTFTGLDKPLYYDTNKKRFEGFNRKIIHVMVDNMPNSFEELSERRGNELDNSINHDCLTTTNVPKGQVHWLREFFQKEHIKKGLINLNDEDFVFISDLDEIWNPNVILNYDYDTIYRLNQKVYCYYLNNLSSEHWYGTVGTKYKNLKNYSVNHIRTPNMNSYTLVDNAGWHFTFQGGGENIRKKIESYGHQELNRDDIKSQINNRLNNNTDIFGRPNKLVVDNTNLPKYVLENINKYKHMLK